MFLIVCYQSSCGSMSHFFEHLIFQKQLVFAKEVFVTPSPSIILDHSSTPEQDRCYTQLKIFTDEFVALMSAVLITNAASASPTSSVQHFVTVNVVTVASCGACLMRWVHVGCLYVRLEIKTRVFDVSLWMFRFFKLPSGLIQNFQ